MTTTLGIDLASRPASTAVCAISWGGDPTVVALARGALGPGRARPLDDYRLGALLRGDHDLVPGPVTKVAIDAPFGWPDAFVDALAGRRPWSSAGVGVDRRLTHRATDRWIHERTGRLPLSVSTDRIAYPAMRLAGLFAEHVDADDEVDRSGRGGRFCEAYPAVAVDALGLRSGVAGATGTYKGAAGRPARRAIVAELRRRAPWLVIADDRVAACVAHDDALDALLCALVARAVERRLTPPIPSVLDGAARREGWIHVPFDGALERLR
ncbi:MAG: DUF429 domain-containing protein [Solirubrobacteraceae bacterium]|nr:DUF429 domain-containing protein [Solirubrobacteraceae bacterium]